MKLLLLVPVGCIAYWRIFNRICILHNHYNCFCALRDYQHTLSSANRRWEMAAQPNTRSLLCSKASSNVCQVSNELLAQRKTSWSQCSFYNGRWLRLQEMLCLWKPYKIQLLLNLDAAIGSMPSSAITFVSDLTTRQSRNNFIPERPAKHQRLNLTSSSSGS